MNDAYIVLASLTSANRLKQYCKKKYDILVFVMQTPKSLQINGCGYCLKVEYENINVVFEAIRVLGVTTKGAYDSKTHKKIK